MTVVPQDLMNIGLVTDDENAVAPAMATDDLMNIGLVTNDENVAAPARATNDLRHRCWSWQIFLIWIQTVLPDPSPLSELVIDFVLSIFSHSSSSKKWRSHSSVVAE